MKKIFANAWGAVITGHTPYKDHKSAKIIPFIIIIAGALLILYCLAD